MKMKTKTKSKKTIEETAGRIAKMMEANGVCSVSLRFTDSFGLDNPITLDYVGKGVDGEMENCEIFTLYSSMNADTNLGSLNLLQEEVCDEDDWFTVEDAVKDVLGF